MFSDDTFGVIKIVNMVHKSKSVSTLRRMIRTRVANVTTLWIWMSGWSFLAAPDRINTPQYDLTVCDLI
jgi:hypothetical protein